MTMQGKYKKWTLWGCRCRGEGVELRPLDLPASRTIALAIPSAAKQSAITDCFARFVKGWVERRTAECVEKNGRVLVDLLQMNIYNSHTR